MLRLSFTTRITLLVTLLSGAVLFLFTTAAGGLAYRSNQMRFDDDLARFALRQVLRSGPPGPRQDLGAFFERTFGQDADSPFVALLAPAGSDRKIQRSENWPLSLTFDRLQAELATLDQGPPPPPPAAAPPLSPLERLRREGMRRMMGRGPGPLFGPPDAPRFLTWREEGDIWRIGVFRAPQGTFAFGQDLRPFRASQAAFVLTLYGMSAGCLLLIAGGGYLVARGALRPVRALTRTMAAIGATGLDRRVPLRREYPEFQALVDVFNDMLARLERSFQQATRFSADAAHELKTPLAVLQLTLEDALQQAPAGSSEQSRYESLLQDVQQLKSITRKLLLLARADAGRLELAQTPVDLGALVGACCEDLEVLAPDKRLRTLLAAEVEVPGDRDLLRQAIQNLIQNAAQYTPAGGEIEVHLEVHANEALVRIRNTGEGVPDAVRARIFDRFYRVDAARSRYHGGAGLGLSLTREIARAHGGDCMLERTESGWTSFALHLPTKLGEGAAKL